MSAYGVQQLLQKMKNSDSDFRYMALNDLMVKAEDSNFSLDDNTEFQTVDQVLSMFEDSNSEVKNQAVKTISVLVKKVKDTRVQNIIDKLTHSIASTKDEQLVDIASLGLKTVVKEIGPDHQLASTLCTKLAPKLISQLDNSSSSQDLLIQLAEILSDIFTRFDNTVKANAQLQKQALKALTALLSDQRSAVRKRAIRALGSLVAASAEDISTNLITHTTIPFLKSGDKNNVVTGVNLAGTLARFAPNRTAKRAPELLRLVLDATHTDDEEQKEASLQTLESMALKCPNEVNTSINQILEVATTSLSYDPNYSADGDDEDEDMADADQSEDVFEEEEYDDDDDVSWKVRRAAVKVLQSIIETRPEMLSTLYQTVSPVLIQRFGEREESVQSEVWQAYASLLRQTRSLSAQATMSPDNADSPATLKRKRDGAETPVEGPLSILQKQVPSVARAMIKQLSTKSAATKQVGFQLLHELLVVAPGCLETFATALFPRIESAVKSSGLSSIGSITILRLETLSFLALFFRSHSFRVATDISPDAVKLLAACIKEKHSKVSSAALRTSAELIHVLRPLGSAPTSSTSPPIQSIYEATVASLSRPDADREVKENGVVTLGELVIYAGDDLGHQLTVALNLLSERMKNEVTRLVAVQTIQRVAEASTTRTATFDSWFSECAEELANYLRKSNKAVQGAAFSCLDVILHRSATSIPANTNQVIVNETQSFVVNLDAHLPKALSILSVILDAHHDILPTINTEILPSIITLAQSTSLQTAAVEGLLRFCQTYVNADGDPLKLFKGLLKDTEQKASDSAKLGGIQSGVVASRCIGAVYRAAFSTYSPNHPAAHGIFADLKKKIEGVKNPSSITCLALLSVGEIGRHIDLKEHQNLFNSILGFLNASSEDVRSAAAFAAGNVAVGNPAAFLPSILAEIDSTGQDEKRRFLLLHALKEVITHSHGEALAGLAEQVWAPLFQICDIVSSSAHNASKDEAKQDGTRSIAAECLGKITLTDPSKYLPQLQARLDSPSPATRAAVVTAIRFTFNDQSSAYDNLLSPLIVQFLSLMKDKDLNVRRLAVSSLNSAAHNKPQLIRDQLPTLLPLLYDETVIDTSLIREVVMGPFKVKVDDGLNVRKAAYQCMYTLLETCLAQINISEYLSKVLSGIKDEDDIKVQCYLMLLKIANVSPVTVAQRLDAAVDAFESTIKMTLKAEAVKQEVERLADVQKSAVRTVAMLSPLATSNNAPKFTNFAKEVAQGKFAAEFGEALEASTIGKSSISRNGVTGMDLD